MFMQISTTCSVSLAMSGAKLLRLHRQHQRGVSLLFGRERRRFIPEEAGRGPGVRLRQPQQKRL
jgi:hypothetical protein